MSIIRCEKHDRNWDSDYLNGCPLCEVAPVLTEEELDEMLARAEMAAEVTLPVEIFRDLCLQARRAS
jgi:hypothetical protein